MIVRRPQNRPGQKPCVWAVIEYYQPNFSGAAIQAHRILAKLVGRGFRVNVLTMADQAARDLAGQHSMVDGVEIWYLPVVKQHAWQGRMRNGMQSLNAAARRASFDWQVANSIKQHGRPGDIVQLYVVNELSRYVIRTARRLDMHSAIQISLVGSDDPSSFRKGRFGFSTRMKLACFHDADCVIGLSTALTRSCERAGVPSSSIRRIPNGVDLQSIQVGSTTRRDRCQRLGFDALRKRIVFVGSAIHRKGIDVVIPAYVEVAQRHQDVDLLVVGPCDFSDTSRHDPSRKRLVDELRAYVQRHQLSERVYWHGEVSNVQDYLSISDIFFFPTRREGLPNALAEGMAAGLPAVASWIDGVTTDLVEDGREGRLIHGHDPRDYQTVLEELLDNDRVRERMGRSARQRIEREFDLHRIATEYEQLYNGLRSIRQRQPVDAASGCGPELDVACSNVEASASEKPPRDDDEEGVCDES